MSTDARDEWRRAWRELRWRVGPGARQRALQAPHVRGVGNVDRVLALFVIASLPAALLGAWAAGQSLLAGAGGAPGWRGDAIRALGLPASAGQPLAELAAGLIVALPLLAVAVAVALAWETVFAAMRRRPTDPGWFMTAWLFTLLLPPTTPPWQVVIGLSFGLVLGCHIFGGTGRYIASPAVLGAIFLRFAYPSGDGASAWLDVAGSHTWWAATAAGPGGLGTGSALACLFGAAVLAAARIASARTLAGGVIGLGVGWFIAGALGDPVAPQWHAVLGSAAFCWAFTLTDPTVLPLTRPARWAHGILFGLLLILIREGDPTQPEGSLSAVLLAALCVPLLDFAALRWYRARSGGRLELRA